MPRHLRDLSTWGCSVAFLALVISSLVLGDPPAGKSVKVTQLMGDLLVVDPRVAGWEKHEAWIPFRERLIEARRHGVTLIDIDFWSGIRDSVGWEYFDRIISEITAAGMDVAAIISEHPCGRNVQDDVFIPTTRRVQDKLQQRPELAFISEAGKQSPVPSVWATDEMLDDSRADWDDFIRHFAPRAHVFKKIIIGHGDAGEAVISAYHHDRFHHHPHPDGKERHKWEPWEEVMLREVPQAHFPGNGALQASSPLAQQDLRRSLREKYGTIEALNAAWGRKEGEAFESFEKLSVLTTQAEVAEFFANHRQYTQMGQDFFVWYHGSLLKHVFKRMSAAAERFHAPNSPFKHAALAFKVPGVHWSGLHRTAQLTAGLISTEGATANDFIPIRDRQPKSWTPDEGQGYRGWFTQVLVPLKAKYPHVNWEVIFTCGEMSNCKPECFSHGGGHECKCITDGKHAMSMAFSLVQAWGVLGHEYGFPVILENALAENLDDPAKVENLETHLRTFESIKGLSALRISHALDSEAMRKLLLRLAGMSAPAEPCRDHLLNVPAIPIPVPAQ